MPKIVLRRTRSSEDELSRSPCSDKDHLQIEMTHEEGDAPATRKRKRAKDKRSGRGQTTTEMVPVVILIKRGKGYFD